MHADNSPLNTEMSDWEWSYYKSLCSGSQYHTNISGATPPSDQVFQLFMSVIRIRCNLLAGLLLFLTTKHVKRNMLYKTNLRN